jgi:hypothetical protein
MGPSSSAGICVLGVGPSLVLGDVVSYKKTLNFSSTHYHFVIGEEGIDVITANPVALSAKQGLFSCFQLIENRHCADKAVKFVL